MPETLKNRIALITGASRGLGAAIAKAYAAEGAHVILIAKSVGGLEEIDDEIQALGGSATLVPLDLSDGGAIDGLAAPLFERWGKLDILVGNAGIHGKLMPIQQYDPELWSEVFNINVHANWRLIRALDPLLRQSDAGRALFVSAENAIHSKQYWSAYAASKAALESMAFTYAAEVATTAMRVNVIDPGPMNTRLRRTAYPGEKAGTQPEPETKTGIFVSAAKADFDQNGQRLTA